MVDLRRAAAIVGVHEHVTRYAPDKSELQIQGESIIKALEDAGLSKNDVDGLFTASMSVRNSGLNLADYLNMYPKHVDNTTVGGGSFEFHLAHALNAIHAGRINVAVITYATLARSGGVSVGTGGVGRFGHPRLDPSPDSFEELYGLTTVGLYAMIAQRHMHQFGTTPEQLAEIAVAVRHHASMNPEALFRDEITVADVMRSRVISSPLHLNDCCVITDGGGAVVVASPEVARNCKHTPVWVLGTGEAVAHQGAGKRDLIYIAAKQSHEPAFAGSGVTHDDIDMAMIYDSFTITVLETLEDLGFCEKGEGGEFVSGGNLKIGGKLPINTDGGGLSVQPSGDARHLPADGGHPTAAPPVRGHPAPGARLQDRAVPRHRRRAGLPPQRRHRNPGEGLAMPEWNKPLPTVVGETRAYWDACRRGQLLIQHCDKCDEYQFYPRGICSHCWSENPSWFQSTGKGTVWTYTVTYQNRTTGFDQGPYVLALVELEEGVRMFTNIVGCDPGEVTIGMPVEVTFERATDQISVPYFRPAS